RHLGSERFLLLEGKGEEWQTASAHRSEARCRNQDATLHSQPHAHRPAQHSVDEFFDRFRKNAG
ncbi:unnamed protein product, partial [Musa acuminata subsp. burmannicoides]